ncbi:OsmC family protein [Sphingomonas sp. TDK1]|uniref:OsmC family protein n=1 Tax=Sphingomonas sp. TDK1 TaxID=453247 RepID=UPI0007DA4871|nr:OsmC family protein [Sphingomonas sp. TDK1]OAN64078.1 osmotically inducible protein C [Sphingomonas sp. TDK1]
MVHATAHIGPERMETRIQAGHHAIVADEPPGNGGQDAGPAPYDLLLAALAACTAMTLRMYADRKGWRIDSIDVDLRILGVAEGRHIKRTLTIAGPDAAGRARLAEIAERTPVTLTLKQGIAIETTLVEQTA